MGFWQWVAFLTLGFFVARTTFRHRMRLKEQRGAETYAISWGVGAFLLFVVAGWFLHPLMSFLKWVWQALAEVFDRLYTLRNQVVHGGSTWNSSVNRDQLRDGANILGQLVPVIIHLMMENHAALWGDPCYPVVD